MILGSKPGVQVVVGGGSEPPPVEERTACGGCGKRTAVALIRPLLGDLWLHCLACGWKAPVPRRTAADVDRDGTWEKRRQTEQARALHQAEVATVKRNRNGGRKAVSVPIVREALPSTWTTPDALAEATGLHRETVADALRALAREGQAEWRREDWRASAGAPKKLWRRLPEAP